jgi:tetratricopeptide (TPR) repeat protein
VRFLSTYPFGFAGLFFALVILSFMPRHIDSQPPQTQTASIKHGIKLAKMKVFEDAEDKFKAILTQHPENAAAINNHANVYLLTGRYASAMQKYWEAVRYDPEDTNIYLNLGVVYHLQMEITSAEVQIGKQSSKAPKADWENASKSAFDKAFENLQSAADGCLTLKIPAKVTPQYSWVQKLLQEAAARMKKPDDLEPAGDKSINQREIPVYWKTR